MVLGGGKGKTLGTSLVAQARLLGSALPPVTGGLQVDMGCISGGNSPVSARSLRRKASFVTIMAITGADNAASCAGLTLARVVPTK